MTACEWVEVICDSLAGMNIFAQTDSAGVAESFLGDVRQATSETAREAKQTTEQSESKDHASVEVIDERLMPVVDTKNDTRNYSVAESYLKNLVDTENPFETVLEDAQAIYIGKDLPSEYRRSKYTETMRKALRTVKMQAATNLDEMILLATDRKWKKYKRKTQ